MIPAFMILNTLK